MLCWVRLGLKKKLGWVRKKKLGLVGKKKSVWDRLGKKVRLG